MKKSPKKFTINRARWLTGELVRRGIVDSLDSMLRDHQGKQCCLGFYARACGVHPNSLLEVYSPDRLNVPADRLGPLLDKSGIDSPLANSLMGINDDLDSFLTPRKREAKIREKFKSVGVRVTFTGKYPSPKVGK